jgi:hypothetical protein
MECTKSIEEKAKKWLGCFQYIYKR